MQCPGCPDRGRLLRPFSLEHPCIVAANAELPPLFRPGGSGRMPIRAILRKPFDLTPNLPRLLGLEPSCKGGVVNISAGRTCAFTYSLRAWVPERVWVGVQDTDSRKLWP